MAHGRDHRGWPVRVVVPACVDPPDVERLCDRVRAACGDRARPVVCDLGLVARPEALEVAEQLEGAEAAKTR